MLLDGAAALRHVLVYVLHQSESRFLLVSDFDDTHSVFLLDAEFLQGLSHDVHRLAVFILGGSGRTPAWHDVAMQIVEQAVFIHQVVERLGFLLLSALFPAEEDFAERHEHDDADGDDDDAHGEEGEESERLESRLGKHLVDNQVGRRTDEGEHSAQASGEGERHEEARRLHARTCCQAHDDRHHERHRSGIAHEGSDKGGYEHHQQEGDGFVAARECHQFIARQLGETSLHDGSTHHEKADHHNDDGRRETSQSFGWRKNSENQECCQGCERHDVGSHLAPNKHGNRNDQDNKRYCHAIKNFDFFKYDAKILTLFRFFYLYNANFSKNMADYW